MCVRQARFGYSTTLCVGNRPPKDAFLVHVVEARLDFDTEDPCDDTGSVARAGTRRFWRILRRADCRSLCNTFSFNVERQSALSMSAARPVRAQSKIEFEGGRNRRHSGCRVEAVQGCALCFSLLVLIGLAHDMSRMILSDHYPRQPLSNLQVGT